jgi:hypothetical protein
VERVEDREREGRRERDRACMAHNARVQRVCEGKCGELTIHLLLCQDTTDKSSTLNPSPIHYPITTKTFIDPKLVKFQLPIAYLIDTYNNG